ncbi:hypothetical protein [Kitasatospora sp. GAS1066B]|uniref:hypothetical protein n=1 Tax=Kitasatospora sp. GAS1066B TaxID=3156271 RepID=UPI0035150AD1
MPITDVAVPRRARLAFRLILTVAALWSVVLLACVYVTVRLDRAGNTVDQYGDPNLAAGMAETATAAIAVLAAVPTVLWLITTIAFRRGSRLAPVVAALVTALTVLCSIPVLRFTVGLFSGEAYVVAFVVIVDCLSVVAVFAAWTRRS